ncbi:hypothetical protein BST61_g3295 [Cercospora zeina]
MCNGTEGRASHGGRIVILQPVVNNDDDDDLQLCKASRPVLRREFSLRLDDDGERGCTRVTIHGSGSTSSSSSSSSSSLSRASSLSPSSSSSSSGDEVEEEESESEIAGGEETRRFEWKGSSFVIHHDGDLSSSSSGIFDDAASILHRFDVPAMAQDRVPFSLSKRFDLGVGGEGIVGRRVTLVRDHLVVGQGIVGWN